MQLFIIVSCTDKKSLTLVLPVTQNDQNQYNMGTCQHYIVKSALVQEKNQAHERSRSQKEETLSGSIDVL